MTSPDIRPSERFTQSRLPMLAASLDGALLLANDAFCRLVRTPADALLGRPLVGLCRTDAERAQVADVLAAAGAGTQGGELALDLTTQDGTRRAVQLHWTCVVSAEGTSYVTAALVDETGRVEAERALARSEARFRARFDQSSLAQAIIDLTGRVVEVNDAACRLFGRSREEMLTETVAGLTHPDDEGRADAVLRRVLAGEQPSGQVERLVRGPGGAPVSVLVDMALLRDEHGRPELVAGHLLDLTPLRDSERRRAQQDELYAVLSARANDLALVVDAETRLIYVSPSVQHLFGYDADAIAGGVGWDFVHPDDVGPAREELQQVLAQGGSRTVVLRIQDATGAWRWVEETFTNMLGTAVGGVVCNLRDVTEQVEALKALRDSEQRFRAIAETAEEGLWAVAPDGATLYANARMATMLGLTVRDLHERTAVSLLEGEEATQLAARIATRAERGRERYELTYPHPDGTPRRLWVAAAVLHGEDGAAVGSLAMVTDVTDQRRMEAELRRAALHDALTGLPNRTLLVDRLEHALTRDHGPTAVLFVDLDQFKLVNDSLGHGAGDDVLVEVARRLRAAVRPSDTVARFSGDEFVVVCEDLDEVGAHAVAEDLLRALAAPLELAGGQLRVRASVGVAAARSASATDLLRWADAAMYAAKSDGRGRTRVFDPALAEAAEQQYALAADLRKALADGELVMHVQPVVDVHTGAVVGVEALARWTHHERGLVPPAEFAAVAEASGLAGDLDRWAVAAALRAAADLRGAGCLPPDGTVAVNLSAHNLADLGLERLVVRATADAGLAPRHVVLEITEGAVMDDAEVAVAQLGRLRDRGFGVALDDFGTGYSSLAYLRDLPITALKVDRSFVADIAEDRDALAIVASIVDLARAIGVDVVAEGVETPQQAALLRRLGCGRAQGWLWSPAVPVPDAVASGAWRRPYPVGSGRSRVPAADADAPPATAEHGLDRLLALHAEGASLATIAAALNREGFRTPTGVRWHRTSVARVVSEAAYPALREGGQPAGAACETPTPPGVSAP